MTILRDEHQARLNELVVQLQEAADHYQQASERVSSTELARLFERLGERRAEHAGRVARQVRAMGDLPADVNIDREQLEHLLTGIRAALASSQDRLYLEQRIQGEHVLQQQVETALETGMPEGVAAELRVMMADIQATRERLGAFQSDWDGP